MYKKTLSKILFILFTFTFIFLIASIVLGEFGSESNSIIIPIWMFDLKIHRFFFVIAVVFLVCSFLFKLFFLENLSALWTPFFRITWITGENKNNKSRLFSKTKKHSLTKPKKNNSKSVKERVEEQRKKLVDKNISFNEKKTEREEMEDLKTALRATTIGAADPYREEYQKLKNQK